MQGARDPLSNMWTGPVLFQDQMWTTWEHAIIAVKLDKTSYLGKKQIHKLVLNYKRLGRKY